MTSETVHVETVIHMPLDDGGYLPIRQGISARPTQTPGLVVFPALTGILAIDDDVWHVTHVRSGRRLPVAFTSRQAATDYANELGELGDWDIDWNATKPAIDPVTVLRIAREHGAVIDEKYREIAL